MPSRIRIGPDGGPYVIVEEDNGDVNISSPNGNVDFQTDDISNVGALTADSLNTAQVNATQHVRESDVSGDLGVAVNDTIADLPSSGGIVRVHQKSDGSAYTHSTKVVMDKPGIVIGPGRSVTLSEVDSDIIAWEGQSANCEFRQIRTDVLGGTAGSHTKPIFHIGGRMKCVECEARNGGNQGFAYSDFYSGNGGGFFRCRAFSNGQNISTNNWEGTGFSADFDDRYSFVGSADGSFDANAVTIRDCETGGNAGNGKYMTGNGPRIDGGIDESNAGYGVYFRGVSHGEAGPNYTEANSAGAGIFLDSNTDNSEIPQGTITVDGVTDNGTNNIVDGGP